MLIVFIRFVWEFKPQKMDQVWIQIPRVSLEYTDHSSDKATQFHNWCLNGVLETLFFLLLLPVNVAPRGWHISLGMEKHWEPQFLSSEPFLFLSISSLTALVLTLLNSGLLILGFNYRFLSQNIIQRSQTCLLLIRENYIYSSNCYDMT